MAVSAKARQMAAIIERDEPDGTWRCRYCRVLVMPLVYPLVWDGRPYPERDHVVPRSRGGAGTMANSAVACQPCNVRKGARLLSELPAQWWTGVRA